MRPFALIPVILALAAASLPAQVQQDAPPQPDNPQTPWEFRYSLAAIDDLTVYSQLQPTIPAAAAQLLTQPTVTLFQNQFLLEPSFALRYQSRWTLSTSLAGDAASFHGLSAGQFNPPAGNPAVSAALDSSLNPYTGTHAQVRVKEAYAGLSAGDFDFMAGRRMVRWGTGYAFTAAGVLDPPRIPTNPTDRLNLNQGRDMLKADFVHGPHALTAVWSTAALAPAAANLHDTTAVRYNVLVKGFDTSLIAGDDRGGDAFGGLTFTRVFGEAWELHGEAAWREHPAALLGAKFTTHSGVNFMAEFFAPPNTPYFRDTSISPFAGRQNYGFFRVGKSRLRELPGWKEWDLAASLVANLNDRSYTAVFDATRRFGNRFSSYVHLEAPAGAKSTDYGATPYTTATSIGVRFQL